MHNIKFEQKIYNILIISNETKIIKKLSILFEKSKYNFILAREPLTAIKKIKSKKFDLVLIDYIYPQFLLIELLEKIKFFDKYIYCILLTTSKNLTNTFEIIKNFDILGG